MNDFSQCSQRTKGEFGRIVGYYAWFRLLSGYTAELYVSRAEVDYHARKYSKSYQYDLRFGRQTSLWSTNFDSMARKTVLKQLLSRWGILSIDVQRAIQDDQKVYDASGESSYADSQGGFIAAEDPFTAEGRVVDENAEAAKPSEHEELPFTDTEQPPTETATGDAPPTADESDEPEEVDITKMSGFDTADEDYITRLNRAELLFIDELGAQRGTDTAMEKVYNVIDSRYRARKPLILTTNLEMEVFSDNN